jgi:hypothetical protein
MGLKKLNIEHRTPNIERRMGNTVKGKRKPHATGYELGRVEAQN